MMTSFGSGYTLTVRYTRSMVPPELRYFTTTVIFSSETTKLIIAILMLFRDNNCKFSKFGSCLKTYYFAAPGELFKMSVASMAYSLQNNLDFVALTNLDAGLYQITTQLKVVTTALFMMAFFGRRFSIIRWIAIVLLFIGVATVQMNNVTTQFTSSTGENYFIGIIAVLATCLTAGFANVYFEKMLKDGNEVPFWIRNLQMYSCGVISAFLACLFKDGYRIIEKGVFYGYNYKVCLVVGFLSLGGIHISLVVKHLDSMYKSYASAMSIILVVILSYLIFDNVFIGAYFVIGTMIVVIAILLYNSVLE